jgi:hypothetical protein
VVVKEDEEAVISGISATTSEPLTFDTLYQKLNEISIKKTQVLDANENVLEPGSPLHYITNVKVPTEQGTLYYNYDSESNTGAGVGSTDRFAYQRTASIQQTLDKLYFVPKQGYNGVAEITLVGWAENGSSFSITVKVDVAGSQGIRYKTTSGKPAYFLGSDFNAYCRVRTGRDLSYVTFNLPQSSQGGLYYGYTSAGQYAGRVSTSTQYARTGRYTIDDVCFVPTDAFVGETRISYRCVDTSGNAFTGEVIINVTPSGAMGETATVRQTGQWGEPVRLRPASPPSGTPWPMSASSCPPMTRARCTTTTRAAPAAGWTAPAATTTAAVRGWAASPSCPPPTARTRWPSRTPGMARGAPPTPEPSISPWGRRTAPPSATPSPRRRR